MFRVALLAIGLVAIGLATATSLTEAALAQTGFVPAPPYYAMSPGSSPGPGTQSPVQQQIQENYHFQLLQTQREMLLQNPSGLGRDQIEVNRQLNMYSAPPPAAAYTPPPPAATPARSPPAAYYAAPRAYDGPPPVHRRAARHFAPRPPTSDAARPR